MWLRLRKEDDGDWVRNQKKKKKNAVLQVDSYCTVGSVVGYYFRMKELDIVASTNHFTAYKYL